MEVRSHVLIVSDIVWIGEDVVDLNSQVLFTYQKKKP